MQFDEAETKIKEHPVELILVITGVSVLGYLYHQRKQEKKRQHELELAKIQAMNPPKCAHMGRRFRRKHYVLDFAA